MSIALTPDAPRKLRATKPQPLEVASHQHALLRLETVVAITGLSTATIHRKVAARTFPQPVRPSANCTRWKAAEVNAWIASLGARA